MAQTPESAFSDFLRHYVPSQADRPRDMLEGRYKIELSQPLSQFDTKTARAYAVSDQIIAGRQLYALVCQPGTLPRFRLVQPLKNMTNPNLLPLIASGIVAMSQPNEERFIIVYERPAGKKLSELMAETKPPLNDQFINRGIIAPIAAVIQQLSELGITHGAINPNNVYFGEKVVLGDCVSEPCGFSQPFYFEPLERIQALPAGKGDGEASVDYYALAVLTLYLLYGTSHFSDLTQPLFIRSIFKEGAYHALTRHKEYPEIFQDFFRGMFSQGQHDRWSGKQLKSWLEGKRYNVLLPPPPGEAIRPFELGEIQANTRRELAHVLYGEWGRIQEVLQNGQLLHWVTVSLRNKELGEQISRITRSIGELGSKNETQVNEQLMRVLVLLDPIGPIRITTLAFHADGIDSLVAALFATRSEKEIQTLAYFTEFSMINFWLDLQRKQEDYAIPETVNTMLMRLERVRIGIRNAGLGFGIERMLYELNPEMPCLSPLLAGSYVNTLPMMLATLDQLSPRLFKDQDPIDRHIAAFVANRLNIQHDTKLTELEGVPGLASHKAVIALKLLAMAQEKGGDTPLPGLAHWLALRILPALESVRSKSLREFLKVRILEHTRTGYLSQLAEFVIASGYASADREGFETARARFHDSVTKIIEYRRGDQINQKSQSLGYVIAKAFAYTALLVTLLSVFKDMPS